jgi:hypothetical protein
MIPSALYLHSSSSSIFSSSTTARRSAPSFSASVISESRVIGVGDGVVAERDLARVFSLAKPDA